MLSGPLNHHQHTFFMLARVCMRFYVFQFASASDPDSLRRYLKFNGGQKPELFDADSIGKLAGYGPGYPTVHRPPPPGGLQLGASSCRPPIYNFPPARYKYYVARHERGREKNMIASPIFICKKAKGKSTKISLFSQIEPNSIEQALARSS